MDKLFDNIKKGINIAVTEAGKLTKVVKNKTSNIVDVTKLNISLNETEGKIAKLYAKIGESVYKNSQGENSPIDIDAVCNEISALFEEAASIREQIAELKNTVVCIKCGEHNEKTSGYCAKCGNKLSADDSDEDMVIEVTDYPEN